MTDEEKNIKNYGGGINSCNNTVNVIKNFCNEQNNSRKSNNNNNNNKIINNNHNKLDKNIIFNTNLADINDINNTIKNENKDYSIKATKGTTTKSVMDYSKLNYGNVNSSSSSSRGGGGSGDGGNCINGGGGGRLQFFKDGKFILEIARTPEGEKGKWVSVPRKINKRQFNVASVIMSESSTSLSLSDDNSSIQSSPRQRERSWKQTMPRKHNSSGITLVLHKNKLNKLHSLTKLKNDKKLLIRLRKRPFYELSSYSSIYQDLDSHVKFNNNDNAQIKNDKKIKTEKKIKENLNDIAQKLTEKLTIKKSLDMKSHLYDNKINNILPSSSASRILDVQYNQHVSPRKRILKELEKVTLEDNTKRHRPKCTTSSSTVKSTNTETVPKMSKKLQNDESLNSKSDKNHTPKTSSKQYSSYSINSLLGNGNNSSNTNEKNKSKSSIHEYAEISKISIDSMTKIKDYNRAENLVNRNVQYSSLTRDVEKNSNNNSIDYENNNISTSENYLYKKHFKKMNLLKSNEKSQNLNYSTSTPTPSSSSSSLSPSSKSLNDDLYKNVKSETSPSSFTLNHNIYSSPFIPITKYLNSNDVSGTGSNYDIKRLNRPNDFDSSIGIKNRKIRESQISPTTTTEDLSYTKNIHSNYNTIKEECDRNNGTKLSSPRQEIYKNKLYNNSDLTKSLHQPPAQQQQQPQQQQQQQHHHPSHSIPTPPLYYLYSQNGLPHSNPYIPTAVPYYHPYATTAAAAAAATLRNSLWLNYQSSISNIPPSSLARLASPFYSYNGMPSLSSSVDSLQMNSIKSNLEQKSVSTNSVAVYVNEDCNSDVPLNLSKH